MLHALSSLLIVLAMAAYKFVLPVLKKLGFGYIVYRGFDIIMDTISSYIIANFDGLPVYLVSFVNLLGFSDYLSIILSAITLRMTYHQLFGGKQLQIIETEE